MALILALTLGACGLATAVAPSASAVCVAYFSVAQRPAVGQALTAQFSNTSGWPVSDCTNLTPGWTDSVHPSWYRTRYSSGGTTWELVKSGAATPYNTYTPSSSDAGYELAITTRPISENSMTYIGVVAYTPTVTPAVTGKGPLSGGTRVSMSGTGYDGILGATGSVTFGGVAGTGINYPCTYFGCLSVDSPQHAAGTVDVNVVNAYSTTKVGTFTYYDAPTVTSASPSSGSTAGGSWVTLTGTGFTGATSVSFGGTYRYSPNFVVDSDTSMRVYRPSHAAGTVSVVVYGPGGNNANNSVYAYITVPPVVNSALTRSATVGAAMSTYTVSGTNTPTSYSASGLPAGLVINPSNGEITGTPTVAGTFNVTIGASNSAGEGTATLVVAVAMGAQSTLTLSSTSATYGAVLSLASSGGSGTGALSYAVTSAGTAGCSLASATTLAVTTVGSCTVTATKAADDNYNSASSAATTVSVGKASQAALSLTSTLGTYGTALPLTSSGGSGSGAVTYSVTSAGTAGCSLASATSLTSTGAGACTVTVTKTLDTNYRAASSTVTTVTFAARAQTSAVTMTSSTEKTFGSAHTLTSSGGSGTGAVSYSVVDAGTANCSVTGTQLTSSGDVGSTCTVKATKADDTDNLARHSDPQTITVAAKAVQPTLAVTSPAITFGTPVALTNTGGAGSGAVTYAVTGAGTAGCSIVAEELRTTGDVGTTCGITAYKAASTNYLQTSSAEVTVTVTGRGTQSISFTAPSDREFSATPFTVAASSDSNLAVSLSTASPTICSAAGHSITMLLPGTCVIDADQTGDGNVLGASTVRRSFEVMPAVQSVAWNPTAGAFSTASPLTMTAAVGSDGGAITYSVIDAGLTHCAIADPILPIVTFDAAGSCTLQAEAAATSTHQAGDSVKVFVIAAPPVAAAASSSSTGSPVAAPVLTVVKVRSLDPIVENGGLTLGAQIVTVDGQPVPVRIEANSTSTGLDVIGTGWNLSLVVRKADGTPRTLSPGGILTVTAGSRIDVTGSGFDELSQVRVYLMSRSVHLGSLMTDRIGDISGSVAVPDGMSVGTDTLQINGFTRDRVVRSLSLGVKVAAANSPSAKAVGSRIYFGYKSATLTSKARRSLLAMVAQVPRGQSVSARVTGALRSKGATALDRSLAIKRASAVQAFLTSHGMSGDVTSSIQRVAVRDRYRDRRVDISCELRGY